MVNSQEILGKSSSGRLYKRGQASSNSSLHMYQLLHKLHWTLVLESTFIVQGTKFLACRCNNVLYMRGVPEDEAMDAT